MRPLDDWAEMVVHSTENGSAGGLGIGMGPALSSAPVRRSVGPEYEDAYAYALHCMGRVCRHEPTTAWRAYAVFMALPGAAIPPSRATPPHSAPIVVVVA